MSKTSSTDTAWSLDPDRALPAEPGQRDIARVLYQETADLPIVSMHGHVAVEAILENESFGDPAELFVIPDHYLVRMLVSQGYSPADLGVPGVGTSAPPSETDHRKIWRLFC